MISFSFCYNIPSFYYYWLQLHAYTSSPLVSPQVSPEKVQPACSTISLIQITQGRCSSSNYQKFQIDGNIKFQIFSCMHIRSSSRMASMVAASRSFHAQKYGSRTSSKTGASAVLGRGKRCGSNYSSSSSLSLSVHQYLTVGSRDCYTVFHSSSHQYEMPF